MDRVVDEGCVVIGFQEFRIQQDADMAMGTYASVPDRHRSSGQGGSLCAKINVQGIHKRPPSSVVDG